MGPFSWEPDAIEDSKPEPMAYDGWGYTPIALEPALGEAGASDKALPTRDEVDGAMKRLDAHSRLR